MIKQIIFALSILVTIGFFAYSVKRLVSFFKLTKQAYPIKDFGKRFSMMFKVAFLQSKIFRKPVVGLMHALVFWGFCVIIVGSIEMIIDGLIGTERILSILGPFYDIFMALGDISAYMIAVFIIIFLFRRVFMHIKRFEGPEMKKKNHYDANFALSLILILMLTIAGINIGYIGMHPNSYLGLYPISEIIAPALSSCTPSCIHLFHEINWWVHILLIFFFANILPYSKHFHIFMSIPNVFVSRLEPLGKLPNMDNVTKEVKIMLDPEAAYAEPAEGEEDTVERFGVKDIEDISWKNYIDSLACTQCGRCTSVCPANITGKKLSPRKLLIDIRQRMNEKGPKLVKEGKDFSDNKSLIGDYITNEELWACTTCNACAQECPININHPTIIIDLRRYIVMEEAAAPSELNAIFTNIENNGAPWQFSPEDRLLWAE